MKSLILSIGVALLLMSCEKDDNINSAQVFNNTKGTTLSITNSKWYTTKTGNKGNTFGAVNLSIAGSTNADKIEIVTYGDGLIGEQTLTLDSEKNFKKDTIVISFLHFSDSIPTTEFESTTKIYAYKGLDTLIVNLKSCKLHY